MSNSRNRCSNGEMAKLESNHNDKDKTHDMEDAGTENENCESDESSLKRKMAKKRHDTYVNESENIDKRQRLPKTSKLLSVSAPATISSHGYVK